MLSIPLWSFYGLCHVLYFKSSLFPLPSLSCRRAVLVRHLASLSSLFLPALYQCSSASNGVSVWHSSVIALEVIRSFFLVTVMEGSMLTFAYVK